jgi:hypothetical protein
VAITVARVIDEATRSWASSVAAVSASRVCPMEASMMSLSAWISVQRPRVAAWSATASSTKATMAAS